MKVQSRNDNIAYYHDNTEKDEVIMLADEIVTQSDYKIVRHGNRRFLSSFSMLLHVLYLSVYWRPAYI